MAGSNAVVSLSNTLEFVVAKRRFCSQKEVPKCFYVATC